MISLDVGAAAARRALASLRGSDDDRGPGVYAAAVWSVITEPGDGVAGRLIAGLGAEEALHRVAGEDAIPGLGLTDEEVRAGRARWIPRLAAPAIDRALGLARRAGARLVVPGDEEWPTRVDDLGDHVPHAFWVRGGFDRLDEAPAVALVGARAATGYGDHVAGELSTGLAADGVTVVSGAAYGIDGTAHRGALTAGGRTIALLAGGVDRPYPSGHAQLIGSIAREGAVASETPCGTAPSKWRFLARNRLIAALADATIVVEAGLRSGSLNTAAHTASLARPLGAVPGSITSAASAGCHRILREFDGVCITGVDDARELIGLPVAAAPDGTARTDDLTRVLDAASTRVARSAADLASRSGLAESDVQTLLGLAALSGAVTRGPDGWLRASTR